MIARGVVRRFADSPFGVMGFMDLFDPAGALVLRLCTLEDDWLANQPRVSCIPAGSYVARRIISPKHGECFEVSGVPGRSAILIHPGNTEEDTEGCLLLGMAFGALRVPDEDGAPKTEVMKWAVVSSKEAVVRFMAALTGVELFSLEVRWALPGEWRDVVRPAPIA